MKLSVVIIAKNAENNIVDALETVSFVDEIIVIDNESKDRTVDVSEKFGAKVFVHTSQDFSELRNFGLKKAKGEWVLYIDTDERVSSELAENIRQIVSEKKDFSAYKIKRKNFYYGNHEWSYIEKLERLFLRKKLKEWYGQLHESPRFDGKVGELNGFLLHYTHRDLTIMLQKTIEWSDTEAKLRLAANHPKITWWRFLRVMSTAFFDSYIRQSGWKAGIAGIVESIYQAFSMFITYAKLWEMQKNKIRNV